MVRAEDFIPLSAATSRGSVQQGLSVAGGALGLFQLSIATDKRYSLELMSNISTIWRRGLASLVKVFMAIVMLTGLIGIPYLVVGAGWDFLVGLYHEHTVWFVLLLLPVLWLVIAVWKWLYKCLGNLMMAIGRIVDSLERETP